MSRIIKLSVLSGLIAAGIATASVEPRAAWAEQPGLGTPPSEGFVLLRNGNVLKGRISPTEQGYLVVMDGGRIVVRAEEVELCCRTLEEAYQRKRSALQQGDVRAHLALAQWSQRHDLLGCAARELAEVKALAPTHPMIPLVERRIQMSLCPPETVERPVGRVGQTPSFEDLDRLVRSMPPRSVERFTQTIQPLLVNHCSTVGCHGPEAKSRFRLLRTPSGRPPSRRLTQRNLQSTLEWIDRGNPAASELLSAPTRPHGSAQDAIFTDRQVDQYKQIVDWVHCVAAGNEPVDTASHQQPRQEASAQDDARQTVTPAVHTDPVGPSNDGFLGGHLQLFPNVAGSSGSIGSVPTLTELGRPSGLPSPLLQPNMNRSSATKQDATPPTYVPVDPFDAEVFNRRFFPASRGSTRGVPDPGTNQL